MARVDQSAERTWMGHPRQLAWLFSIEAWERFGFNGMRALLVLYLTYHFLIGEQASGIVGSYLSLAYLTPLVGGWLADRYLGSKRAVKFGAVLMTAGYLLLCFGGPQAKPYVLIDDVRYDVAETAGGSLLRPIEKSQTITKNGQAVQIHGLQDGSVQLIAGDGRVAETITRDRFHADGERSPFHMMLMLLALSLVAVGTGFFKPNISTMVGTLYGPGDRRRDAGFTIFYWGINIGSIGSQTLCPLVVDWFGWWAGFLVIAIGMGMSYGLMQIAGSRLSGYGEPPAREGADRAWLVYILTLLTVPLFTVILYNVVDTPEPPAGGGFVAYIIAQPLLGKLLFFTFLAAVIGIPAWAWRVGTKAEAQMMLAAIILIVFNVTFWTLFEQAASSLTLFADRNTTLNLSGLPLSAAQTLNFNPLSIVVMAPIMGWLWLKLANRGWEPSLQAKFGIALILMGLSFLVLAWSGEFANAEFRVSLWWLALSYFLGAVAELCISPVGLSMITKLSLPRVVGLMMGVWFLSISVAQYFAGAIAQAASVKTLGGQVMNPELSLLSFTHSFMVGGTSTIVAGLVLLAISPLLRRLMHGVS